MALADISISNYTKVLMGTKEIEFVEELSGITAESTIVDVRHYGTRYSRKVVGSASAGPITLTLSYAPDAESQVALDQAYEAADKQDFEIRFYETAGSSTVAKTITFTGIVASKDLGNAYDSQRQVTYSIAVDGGFTDA